MQVTNSETGLYRGDGRGESDMSLILNQ